MAKIAAGAALAAFIVLAVATDALSQGSNCGQRDDVVERLASKYGETRRSMGLGSRNQIVEVFASDETGTWTITVTMPTGITCLVASGQAYEEVHAEPAGMKL
jgi:hypothetical protein